MGCGGCSSGGCGSGLPRGCRSNGNCGSGGCNKLSVFDWLSNIELPSNQDPFWGVEVRFKGSRKEFFRNHEQLPLKVGDVVAVEGSPGHDIGTVSMVGELVRLQMKKKTKSTDTSELKKIYRLAKDTDIAKWQEAVDLEHSTMHGARKAAEYLGLEMKISDVEYQGDKTKAIFYYTANGRVDFRELIKRLSGEFRIRVEMKQIGARQEASRLGGIGACGRELCCSSWLSDFRTVSTSAARYQQLSINPQKLAGQCGKLKCCLNYELDAYMEGIKEFPNNRIKLNTKKGLANFVKMDIFQRKMWYAYEDHSVGGIVELSLDRVLDIIEMNKNGEQADKLEDYFDKTEAAPQVDYENVVGQDSINRFDNKNKRNKGRKRRSNNSSRRKGGNNKGRSKNEGAKTEASKSNNRNRNRNKSRGPKKTTS
jgi:cell fate regulator YaaT (PSP1 superfamily)